MTESVWGSTAAPHPAAPAQVWELDGAMDAEEAGTFDLKVTVRSTGRPSATVAAVDFDVTAAALETALQALDGIGNVSNVSVEGGPLGTDALTITFPANSVDLTLDTTDLTKEASEISVTLTEQGVDRTGNVTVLNPTGADQANKTVYRNTYSRKYGDETMKNSDGTTITSGGGVDA